MSSADSRAGFTLIEMVAVMAIIALATSLAITAMPGTGRAGLEAVALDTAAMLRRERVSAVLGGRSRRVALDGDRRMLVGEGGERLAIPRDVVLDVLGMNALWGGMLAIARFDPDGTSSGAVLKYSRQGAAYEIQVNWYTGGVAVVAAR
jgi:general secretion pathway protein H